MGGELGTLRSEKCVVLQVLFFCLFSLVFRSGLNKDMHFPEEYLVLFGLGTLRSENSFFVFLFQDWALIRTCISRRILSFIFKAGLRTKNNEFDYDFLLFCCKGSQNRTTTMAHMAPTVFLGEVLVAGRGACL